MPDRNPGGGFTFDPDHHNHGSGSSCACTVTRLARMHRCGCDLLTPLQPSMRLSVGRLGTGPHLCCVASGCPTRYLWSAICCSQGRKQPKLHDFHRLPHLTCPVSKTNNPCTGLEHSSTWGLGLRRWTEDSWAEAPEAKADVLSSPVRWAGPRLKTGGHAFGEDTRGTHRR